jgi:uncharacterized protein YjiS (DUF1127 family)
MTMTTLGQPLAADRSAPGHFFASAVDIRAGGNFLARLVRIRRGRAELDELPDYLLRDIGIQRSEIRSVTRYGRSGDRSG